MCLAVGFLACVLALSEHKGVGKGAPAAGDVDGATAGEIESRELVQPAVGVPGPACDGAVDDGGPEEAKDEGGDDTAALE